MTKLEEMSYDQLREKDRELAETQLKLKEELLRLREQGVPEPPQNPTGGNNNPGGGSSETPTTGWEHKEPDIDNMDPPQHMLENPPDFDSDDVMRGLQEAVKLTEKGTRPTPKKGAPKSPPKGYPTSADDYADPENHKYPLDTEKHVRAALAYFSKPENRSKGGYSPAEQKFMWGRIIRAAKKYDIELSPDVAKKAEMIKLAEKVATPESGGERMADSPDSSPDSSPDATKQTEAQLTAKMENYLKEQFGKMREEAAPASAAAVKDLGEKLTKLEAKLDAAMKTSGDAMDDIKAKHADLTDKLGALKEKMEAGLKEQKTQEQKIKEMQANSNAGTVVAKLEEMFGPGALPPGARAPVNEHVDEDAPPKNLGDLMESSKRYRTKTSTSQTQQQTQTA